MARMLRTFLSVYREAGLALLVLLAVAFCLFVLMRFRGPSPSRTQRTAEQTPAVCPKCAGRGRFVDADGYEWPCLNRDYHAAG